MSCPVVTYIRVSWFRRRSKFIYVRLFDTSSVYPFCSSESWSSLVIVRTNSQHSPSSGGSVGPPIPE